MDWQQIIAAPLRDVDAYRPGLTEERLRRETGLAEILKFSSNETPVPPSPAVMAAMQAALGQAHRYPDAQALTERLAAHLGVAAAQLVLGCGSIDVIEALVRAVVGRGDNVVLSSHGYCAYPALVKAQGGAVRSVPSDRHFGHDVDALLAGIDGRTRLLMIDSPGNLSGRALDAPALARLLERLPRRVLLLLDQAYAEFDDGAAAPRDVPQLPARYPNLVVTRSFSKAHGLAGLRIGYGIADAGLVPWLLRIRPPFPVGRVALAGALAALDDAAHLQRIVAGAHVGRRLLAEGLRACGAAVVDGRANFVLAGFGERAAPLYQGLLARGFITRAMQAYGLPHHLRITAGTADEIERLLAAVRSLLQARPAPHATEEAA